MKKIFALLLALVMMMTFAACNTSGENESTGSTEARFDPAAKSEGVMTYAEYAAAAMDSEVVIECYVQATQSWWFDSEVNHGKITVYAQDPDGAYFLYEMTCTEEDAAKLIAGTKIKVTGYKSEWSGEIEVTDATFEFVESQTWIAEAMDATALLGTDSLIDHQNKLVSFKGMTVVAANDEGDAFLYKWNGSGSAGDDLYFNVSIDGKTYTFCVESYLTGDGTDVYEAVEALNVGDVIDLEGFLYWYNGAQPHITSVTAAN